MKSSFDQQEVDLQCIKKTFSSTLVDKIKLKFRINSLKWLFSRSILDNISYEIQ